MIARSTWIAISCAASTVSDGSTSMSRSTTSTEPSRRTRVRWGLPAPGTAATAAKISEYGPSPSVPSMSSVLVSRKIPMATFSTQIDTRSAVTRSSTGMLNT
ncbi:MAG: hypothetical protein BWX86_02919 [Verrucomicrobia bacterium ADurb.Bin122]|nr:MAG: hypothetical protein BWX86_02919 [Verrucomicrobia bacterium ADurb.Bin122]